MSDEQAASYGKFNEEPTRPELDRFFSVEEAAPRAAVMSAAAPVAALVPEDEDSAGVVMRAALTTRYNAVRPFLALPGEPKAPRRRLPARGYWPGSGGCPRRPGGG
ncbi:hypothetical protein OG463_00230 [Streptomyces xinghaiensis]|nr:hypothetical protein OG463_00230 [Streptomyces xinghaiensis]